MFINFVEKLGHLPLHEPGLSFDFAYRHGMMTLLPQFNNMQRIYPNNILLYIFRVGRHQLIYNGFLCCFHRKNGK